MQTGALEIEEHSHAGMANRYVASASGLPFAVMRGYNGTSLPEHTDTIKSITCPFTGEQLTAVPALGLDVGIIHAQRADRQGNVQLWGQTGVQKETVLGAKRSIVTVEEIVDELDDRPYAVVLPRWVVTRVCEVPGGAKPSYAQDYYDRDNDAYKAWDAISPGPRAVRPVAGGAVSDYEADEMMSVEAARQLRDTTACFVGIGLPSTGANLARRTHNPDLVLVYEAGAIGAKPPRLPLSIGDGMLGETADYIAAVPEIFNYWVQPGRIDVGFLGAAQIDRFANINTTVVGDYAHPKVRLPGAGGAPEIAASCGEVIVIVRQTKRAFVEKVDFITSVGHVDGPGARERLGLRGKGPTKVITDLGILEPDPETRELVLTHVHPGITAEQAQEATGWDLRIADDLQTTEPPTEEELKALRELVAA